MVFLILSSLQGKRPSALRWSRDAQRRKLLCRWPPGYLNILNISALRAASQRLDQLRQQARWPLGDNRHRVVRLVARESGKAKRAGMLQHVVAVANALHVAAYGGGQPLLIM